ncbi:MAG: hypothetical protein RI907_3415 [Pseudomonadota bacterium]|jgi:signal transduction histidine kinase
MCPTLLHPLEAPDLGATVGLPPPGGADGVEGIDLLVLRLDEVAQAFASDTGVVTDWSSDAERDPTGLPPALSALVFDTLCAALDNVAHHSHAQGVVARLRHSGSDLSLLVRDDGRGAPPSAFTREAHTTLSQLRARADLLGGWLQIDSQLGQGTQLILSLPLPFKRSR